MFCSSCGEEIKEGSAFCNKCGKNVNRDNSILSTLSSNKPTPVLHWVGLILLFCVPFLGILIYIGLAFGSKNANIKNYARAVLILCVIVFILFSVFLSDDVIKGMCDLLMELY